MFLNAFAAAASVAAALQGYGAVEDHGRILEANNQAAISSDLQTIERHDDDANEARDDRNIHIVNIVPNLGAIGMVSLMKEEKDRKRKNGVYS